MAMTLETMEDWEQVHGMAWFVSMVYEKQTHNKGEYIHRLVLFETR